MAIVDWWENLSEGRGGAVVWAAVALGVTLLGSWVIGKLRDKFRETGPTASDFVTNFRELNEQGVLSDEEYRTIKAMLAVPLKQQVNRRTPQRSTPPTSPAEKSPTDEIDFVPNGLPPAAPPDRTLSAKMNDRTSDPSEATLPPHNGDSNADTSSNEFGQET